MGHHPHSDVSVRPSIAEDATALARLQVAVLHDTYARLLPPDAVAEMGTLEVDSIAASWLTAIQDPPDSRHRVLTALAGPDIVGFAAFAPAAEEPQIGEVITLEVAPASRGQGHGSRLLAACADLLRDSGASAVRVWVLAGDERRGAFLGSAGLAPTGLRRTLATGADAMAEEAWSATLSG